MNIYNFTSDATGVGTMNEHIKRAKLVTTNVLSTHDHE